MLGSFFPACSFLTQKTGPGHCRTVLCPLLGSWILVSSVGVSVPEELRCFSFFFFIFPPVKEVPNLFCFFSYLVVISLLHFVLFMVFCFLLFLVGCFFSISGN